MIVATQTRASRDASPGALLAQTSPGGREQGAKLLTAAKSLAVTLPQPYQCHPVGDASYRGHHTRWFASRAPPVLPRVEADTAEVTYRGHQALLPNVDNVRRL